MKKRVLSLFMALTLCLTLLPTAVFAADGDGSISGGVIGGGETGTGGGGIYVPPGGPTEGGGGTYIPGEDTRTEIWCVSKPDSIGRSYDGTTDGGRIPINLTFTDGTNEIEFKEGTDFSAVKTFDSADAGWHTVTVEITLIGEAAAKYKLKAGEEKSEIGGNINKAYPDLTVSLSRATCAVGEKLLPLLSVSGVKEDAAVTYYYTQYKTIAGDSAFEGSEAMPKVDENTAIDKLDEEGNNTYYVYARTAATKNYNEGISDIVELTVSNDVASVTASGGVTTNYTSLDDALDAMKDGDTVTLLSDAEITRWHSLSKAFTLELNGKTATTQSNAELYLHARVIVQDSSTGKTGGMAGTYLLNVQEGGDLIIQSGTFNGRIAINVGKLTIEGGTFNQEVALPRGDSDSVFFSGGTFAKIWYPNSSGSFLDLLADGYAFYDKNGKLVNAAKITDTNLYNVHIGTHAHSFTGGACACGYTCPHTSVDESGACTVCGKQFAASITEGDDVTYYDTFNSALVYAYNNDGCTLKLLADVTEAAVMINNPFLFDLNGHNVGALSVDARATIKDSGTTKGKIGKVTVSTQKVPDLTLGGLLEEGYAFQYENGYWANDSHLRTSDGLKVTVEKAPIQSVAVYAKDKNNKVVPTTIAYGTTGEVTLVSSCRMGETSGADLSYLWYKLEGLAATAPLEGAGANYTLPDNLTAGTHTYLLICTSDGYSKSAEITVTVTPVSLAGAEVTVQSPTYNGKEQSPTVTVKLGDKTLRRDNDYSMQVTKQTDAGSYKLTIKGGGNYSGTIEKDWKIEPVKIDSVMVSTAAVISKVYDGTAKINMTAEEWAGILEFRPSSASATVAVPIGAYTISDACFLEDRDNQWVDSPEAGKKSAIAYTVTFNNSNYVLQNDSDKEPAASKEYMQSGGANFTIRQANVTSPGEITQLVFNDLAKTYTIDLAKLLPKLSEGCEYGDIQYQGCDYHFTDSTYLDSNNGMSVSKEGILTLPTVSAHTSNVNTQIGTITVPVVTTNYQKFEFTIKVYISARIPLNASGVTVSASEITYGQTLNESKLTATGTMKHPGTGEEVKGTFAWKDGKIIPDAGDYEAEWTFTPGEGYEEYAVATGTVTVKVSKAQMQDVSVLVPNTYYYTGEPQRAGVIAAGLGVCGEQPTFTYSKTENGEYTSEVPEFTEAGTYTAYYKAEAVNHITATGTFSVQIKPLPISLLAVEKISKTYDGTASVTLSTEMLTFFSKAASRQDITLPNTALTFSDAQFTSKQEDGSYLPSPEVGGGKALSFTMTLTSSNYVFEGKSEGTTEVSDVFATDDVNRFTITKAAAPTDIQTGTLNVINGTQQTYTYDFSKLLPELSEGQYGTISYGNQADISLVSQSGYYYDETIVEFKNGVLILAQFYAKDGKLTGQIGTVKVKVTTANYEDFQLTLVLNAINKIKPTPDGKITASNITYGQALSDSSITGKMKDPNTGDEVNGTFSWKQPGDTILDASTLGHSVEWTFTPTDENTYTEATGTVIVKVDKAQQYGEISMAGYSYGGTPSTPTLTDRTGDPNAQVIYNYSAVGIDSVQTWDIQNPPALNAGTYRMFAQIVATDNYYEYNAKYCVFVVAKATPPYTAPTGLTAKYGQTLADVTLPDGWSWMDSSESVGGASVAVKPFKAKFTPTDTANYNTVENIKLDVTVNKANGGSLKTVELEQKYTDTSEHTYTPDWSGLPSGQTWSYSSEYSVSNGSIAKLTKQDIAAANGKLTYAISGGKAGDKITITLKASCDNYEDFTITLNVTLTEKDDQKPLTIIGDTSVIYGEKLTLTTTGGSGTGAVTYHIGEDNTGEATIDPETGVLTPVKVGSVSVIAAKAGDNDYNDITSAPFVLMIKPATPSGEPNYTKITTSGKTLKDAALTAEGSTLKPNGGKLEWVDDKGNVLPDNTRVEAKTTYKWRFTPDDDNYTALTGEVELYHKSSSGGGGSSGYSYYTIKATAGAGGSISPSGNVSVREGRDQTFTITPDKGYAVANVKIDGKSIGAVKSYTFENVRRTHTIEVIFMKANGNPQTGVFVDVATGSYYEDAVDWAVENGITKGTDDTHFSPDGICTRAQAVTFLWRAAGSPEPETRAMPFTDVPAGSYYYDAVLWAVENGITKGTSDTTFSPDATCSRAQIVTFLWRSEKSPAAGTANPFADVKSTAYYAGAVLWAVKEDITKGTTNTTFSPDADCTRAQIVTFLWRCKK